MNKAELLKMLEKYGDSDDLSKILESLNKEPPKPEPPKPEPPKPEPPKPEPPKPEPPKPEPPKPEPPKPEPPKQDIDYDTFIKKLVDATKPKVEDNYNNAEVFI